LPTDLQRKQVDLVQELNRGRLTAKGGDSPELEGVIESMELAFRMQRAVPEVLDLSKESRQTLAAYGIGAGMGGGTENFGRQCLMARRLLEAGVRYVEVSHGNWDQHNNLRKNLSGNCLAVDRPAAALLADLKARDMLKDTLVIWGGEFGRTPGAQNNDGRDHNAAGFTVWLAGGGVKGGIRYGATDDHGVAAVTDKTHVHDLHATILHLMGLDHEKLTYRYGGRDYRLTDVHGEVADGILA
jgi:hypothetical protein